MKFEERYKTTCILVTFVYLPCERRCFETDPLDFNDMDSNRKERRNFQIRQNRSRIIWDPEKSGINK